MKKNLVIVLAVTAVVLIIAIYYFMKSDNANFNQQTQNQTQQQNSDTFNIQGMKVEILRQGSGEQAESGDKVTVDYIGTLQDGIMFDSSISRGVPLPLTLGLNSVIPGWELGVLGMKVGEKRRLTIPPELAYGERGAGNVIPPNATLIFEIDMLKIN